MVLTDFGTSKIVTDEDASTRDSGLIEPNTDVIDEWDRDPRLERKKSFVGTAEYVCPELLRNERVSFQWDIWSLGCVLYTIIAAKPAFRGASEYLTFQKILSRDLVYPEYFPAEAVAFCEFLLVDSPVERPSIDHIKNHSFFSGIEFDTLNLHDSPVLTQYRSVLFDKDNQETSVKASGDDLEPTTLPLPSKTSKMFCIPYFIQLTVS